MEIRNAYTLSGGKSLKKYFQDIQKIPLLTPEEEYQLAQEMKKGGTDGEKAKEKLIISNLRFVVTVAKQFQHYRIPLEDLINEGNMGLIKAVEKYDPEKGTKLISFAVKGIQNAISNALNSDNKMVRIPANKKRELVLISRFRNHFFQENDREPTIEEILEGVNAELPPEKHLTPEKVEESFYLFKPESSLMEKVNRDVSEIKLNQIRSNLSQTPLSSLYQKSFQEEVQSLLKKLPERERKILTHFFGIDRERSLNLQEIAEKIGVTSERVRQLKKEGLLKLREKAGKRKLYEYLNEEDY